MKEIIDQLTEHEAKLRRRIQALETEIRDTKNFLWLNTDGPMEDLYPLAKRAVKQFERNQFFAKVVLVLQAVIFVAAMVLRSTFK